MTGGARALWLAVALAGVSCTNELAAPAICPQFCPTGALVVTDTVLAGVISRDSAYGRPYGYVNPNESLTLLAANVPGLRQSWPVLLMPPLPTSLAVAGTTTGAVVGVDSFTLQVTITRRDTAVHNLQLSVFGLPVPIDSTSTFASLAPAFAAPPVRTLNVDSLVASPNAANAAGDSVLVDTVYNHVTVYVNLDSAEAPYSVADTGQLAFGLQIAAAEPAEVAFGAVLNFGLGPVLIAYLKVDSLGVGICHRQTPLGFGSPIFNSFVFNPPAPPLDSTLVVGGVPATRSILRIAFPRSMVRDSQQIARATLEFVPAVLPRGLPADSFGLVAQAALVDLGSKSSLDPIHVDTTMIYIASVDTVEVNVTNIMRFWAADTLAPTTIVLRGVPEGADFAEIRMFSSATSNPALRPTLHLTYSPSYPFGQR